MKLTEERSTLCSLAEIQREEVDWKLQTKTFSRASACMQIDADRFVYSKMPLNL